MIQRKPDESHRRRGLVGHNASNPKTLKGLLRRQQTRGICRQQAHLDRLSGGDEHHRNPISTIENISSAVERWLTTGIRRSVPATARTLKIRECDQASPAQELLNHGVGRT
jgi:hypothetical protein